MHVELSCQPMQPWRIDLVTGWCRFMERRSRGHLIETLSQQLTIALIQSLGCALEAHEIEQALRSTAHKNLGRLLGVDFAVSLPRVPAALLDSLVVVLLELERNEHQRRIMENRISRDEAASCWIDPEEDGRVETHGILPYLMQAAVPVPIFDLKPAFVERPIPCGDARDGEQIKNRADSLTIWRLEDNLKWRHGASRRRNDPTATGLQAARQPVYRRCAPRGIDTI